MSNKTTSTDASTKVSTTASASTSKQTGTATRKERSGTNTDPAPDQKLAGSPDQKLDGDDHLDQLAQRFLDLWRQQVATTVDGTQAASAIGRLYASLGADTSRMGEGFEAWGNLIGQMAMGQQLGGAMPGMSANPIAGLPVDNPLQAMMDQMAKAARDLPVPPFAGGSFPGVPFPGMPFPPNMTGMSGSGSPGTTGPKTPEEDTTDNTTKTSSGTDSQDDVTSDAIPTAKAGRTTPAKGQGKNDQPATAKETATQTGKSKTGRAKAASDAHGSRDDELAQLARRITDLSETIAALEGRPSGTGKDPSERD
ncbi:hypothetical protein [Thalassospira sp. GB04J01]|uniref:hypothetical protein n=1 Tax=Thalassospira sp. GB04J01 TaxID=1485225 RepID=UPI000C997FD0|nr:hypothetical protein [Thalassospira sp. GB04J01]